MRRNRISMLTDRPDVPRTPFGRLKPPNGVYWGDIRTCLQFNENLFGGCVIPSFIKIKKIAIRGHLQLLEVNSRTFYDISAKKCIFTTDTGQCLVGGFTNCYYCGNNCKAPCTMGQFTVLWCTEALLRQYIPPLCETK